MVGDVDLDLEGVEGLGLDLRGLRGGGDLLDAEDPRGRLLEEGEVRRPGLLERLVVLEVVGGIL